jgi:hypothetical protein
MSRYEALRNGYAAPVAPQLGRTLILRKAAQGILDNLVLFLELPTWSFTDLDGQQMPYVSVGRIEGGEFRLGTIEDFVATGNGLSFSLNVVVDEAADKFPKAHIIFSFTVDDNDGVLTVFNHSADGGPFIIKDLDFTAVSEHIYKVLHSELLDFKGFTATEEPHLAPDKLQI